MGTVNPFGDLGNIPTVAPNFAGQSGGLMSGLSNLFQNQLFRQYLAAAGADLMQRTGGKNLNSAVQGNISSQNYMKVLKAMLAGDIPAGGKVVHTDTGSQFHVPAESLRPQPSALTSPDEQPAAPTTTNTVTAPSTTPTTPASSDMSALIATLGAVNPFDSSLPNFSASDLAGVTPEMISQALQFKMAKAEMGQRSVKDIADMLYRNAMLQHGERQLDIEDRRAAIADAAEARQMLALALKDERPALIQEFEYAKAHGFKGSIDEFKNPQTTADWRDYLATVAQGNTQSFKDYQIELRKAGAMTIGESVSKATETAKALGGLKGQLLFNNPTELTNEVDKILAEKSTAREIRYSDNPAQAKAEKIALSVRRLIEAGGGIVQGSPRLSPDKKVMYWDVKWPSGDVGTVHYAVRD